MPAFCNMQPRLSIGFRLQPVVLPSGCCCCCCSRILTCPSVTLAFMLDVWRAGAAASWYQLASSSGSGSGFNSQACAVVCIDFSLTKAMMCFDATATTLNIVQDCSASHKTDSGSFSGGNDAQRKLSGNLHCFPIWCLHLSASLRGPERKLKVTQPQSVGSSAGRYYGDHSCVQLQHCYR